MIRRMFSKKKKKTVLTDEYKALREEFSASGNMSIASRSYSENWISFDS